jgi:hypothetical protein
MRIDIGSCVLIDLPVIIIVFIPCDEINDSCHYQGHHYPQPNWCTILFSLHVYVCHNVCF